MAKNSDRRNNDRKYFDFQEQEDQYIMNNFGFKPKNRANKKRQTKFSDKKDREYNDY